VNEFRFVLIILIFGIFVFLLIFVHFQPIARLSLAEGALEFGYVSLLAVEADPKVTNKPAKSIQIGVWSALRFGYKDLALMQNHGI